MPPPIETPYAFYFLVAFMLAAVVTGVLLTLVHPLAIQLPMEARALLAALPVIVAIPYALRVAALGRKDNLPVGEALRRALRRDPERHR